MATKLTVPRPDRNGKLKPEATRAPLKTIPDAEVIEEVDNTEPSGPPVIVAAPSPPAEPPAPPPPPEPTPSRPIVASLPSQYELDSERKSSPPVLERRKHFTTVVASCVGVAWFICIVAVGQTAMRSVFFH